jgi:hypothetical protein
VERVRIIGRNYVENESRKCKKKKRDEKNRVGSGEKKEWLFSVFDRWR